jgi:hypothetical protein
MGGSGGPGASGAVGSAGQAALDVGAVIVFVTLAGARVTDAVGEFVTAITGGEGADAGGVGGAGEGGATGADAGAEAAGAAGAGGEAPHDDQPAPASKLREWAKNQGDVQRPGTGTPEGGPETWEDSATGEWKLKLKLPSARPGLHEDSQKPRFSAKDKDGNYHNPLDGTSGARKTHGHIPLDPDS